MNQRFTIKEFQSVLLDMMTEFHRFCEKNGLTYYMVGGTLLGAVREGGFIPWDDDVDFAMPRDDYEKFIQIYEGTLALHCLQNDNEHMFPYIKLFNPQMPLITVDDEQYNFHSEIFVKFDIYPIDGLGNDARKATKRLKKISRKKHLLFLNLTKSKSKNLLKRFVLFFVRKLSPARILKSIDKAMQKYSVEKSMFLTRWREGGAKPNVIKKEIFGSPVLIPFENQNFYAPQDSHTYLSSVYGDYMIRKQSNTAPRHGVARNEIAKKLAQSISEQENK